MMPLQVSIPRDQWSELPRFDFLENLQERIERVDELHPSKDNDSYYIFIIWLKNQDNEEEVLEQIEQNIIKAEGQFENGWSYLLDGTQQGMIILKTWL